MKLKNVLLTLGLAMGVGAASGAVWAMNNHENALESKADSVITGFYVVGGFNSWTANDSSKMDVDANNGILYALTGVSMKVGDEFKIKGENGGDGAWMGYKNFCDGSSTSAIKNCFEGTDGDQSYNKNTNIKVKTDGTYNIYFSPTGSWPIIITTGSDTISAITFDELGDGTWTTNEFFAGSYTVERNPVRVSNNVDQYGSWYIGDTKYNGQALTSSCVLTAKDWTDMEDVRYIYVITGHDADWSSRYIYGYGGGNGFGNFPGKLVSSISAVTNHANFGGGNDSYWNGGIFKVPYFAEYKMSKIIFSNGYSGDNNQAELDLVEGAAYFYNGGNGATKQDATGIDAKLVFDWDLVLGGAGAICSEGGAFYNMDEDERAETFANMYSEYLIAKKNGNNWIDSSVLTESNINASVFAEEFLRYTTRRGYSYDENGNITKPNGLIPSVWPTLVNDDTTPLIVVVLCGFIVVAAVGMFAIRKKDQF